MRKSICIAALVRFVCVTFLGTLAVQPIRAQIVALTGNGHFTSCGGDCGSNPITIAVGAPFTYLYLYDSSTPMSQIYCGSPTCFDAYATVPPGKARISSGPYVFSTPASGPRFSLETIDNYGDSSAFFSNWCCGSVTFPGGTPITFSLDFLFYGARGLFPGPTLPKQFPPFSVITQGAYISVAISVDNINVSLNGVIESLTQDRFAGTLADIANYNQLGLIDNYGIANSLAKKVQAAQNATGPARYNILNAFKNEVNAQSGKHITGIAPQVLLQDADSLIIENQ